MYIQKLFNSHMLWSISLINLCPFLNKLPVWKKIHLSQYLPKQGNYYLMCAYLKPALLPEFMVNGFIFQQREWAQVTRKAHDPVEVTRHFWALLARDVISSSLTDRNGALPSVHKENPETQPTSSRELTIPSSQLSPSFSSSALLPGQHVNLKFLILKQVLELDLCLHWVQGKRY